MATTTTNTTTTTLASRAAVLLTKSTALAMAEKAIAQATAARRVHPAMAEDFGSQLGVELPLKTKDFVAVVGHLLASTEKPLKGAISKRKSEILAILAELVSALTDTQPVALPAWAIPKERTKKAEAEAVDVSGALDRANAQAEANEAAEALAALALSEAKSDNALAEAVALIVARSTELSAVQRDMLMAVVLAAEAEAEAEA